MVFIHNQNFNQFLSFWHSNTIIEKMFSNPDDFYTPELRTLVANKNTPLEDVLSLPYFPKSSRLGFSPVTKYLSNHSEELLQLAFRDDNSALSATAYSCLLTGEPEILMPLFTNGWLLTVAVDLLGNHQTKDYLIGRLASVTLVCFGVLDESILNQCTFIFNFLPHCNNPSAFNLLTSICSENESYVKLQEWLSDLHFFEYVFAEFDTIDYTYQFNKNTTDNIDTTMYKDPVASKCLCLYNLLSCCCESNILKKGFLNDKLIEILLRKFNYDSNNEKQTLKPPDFIRTARWKAITSATQKKISSKMIEFLSEAIDLLTEDFQKLRPYRVSALDFITKMLSLEPSSTTTLLMSSSVPQTLILIIMKFPNSSFFLSSFREFVQAALAIPEFSFILVNIYLPIIISHSPVCAKSKEPEKEVTMNDYDDITLNEVTGKNDVNNIQILFYPATDRNPVKDTLNNIIETEGIKQKHKKKKTFARMIRHLFKKPENKVEEYYKDKSKKRSASLSASNSDKSDNIELTDDDLNPSDSNQQNNAVSLNVSNLSSSKFNKSRHEIEKMYNIDGDFDADETNQESDLNDSKKFDDDDPRRVRVKEADKNDQTFVQDKSDSIPIAFNRIIMPFFAEVVGIFAQFASKNQDLKESIGTVNMVKEYTNGPLKRYNNLCRGNYGIDSNAFYNMLKLLD